MDLCRYKLSHPSLQVPHAFLHVSPDFHWQNTFSTVARDPFRKNTWLQKCDNFPASFTDQE